MGQRLFASLAPMWIAATGRGKLRRTLRIGDHAGFFVVR